MKTLYVSDLDGTLLNGSIQTSAFTNHTINELVRKGMLFSYATARSYQTSHKVTEGLEAKIPLIIYNGAMIVDNADGSFLAKNFFNESVGDLLRDLIAHGIYPIVYAFIEGEEKFSFIPEKCTRGERKFIQSRRKDKRLNSVSTVEELFSGEIFYVTCIDEEEKLSSFYEKYRESYHCVFQADIYTNEQWLEFMPRDVSKANAIKQLKQMLGCGKLVVFGDGKNDIDMFGIADEAYAVANAVEELKAAATGIIGSNVEDGVARWLLSHASCV